MHCVSPVLVQFHCSSSQQCCANAKIWNRIVLVDCCSHTHCCTVIIVIFCDFTILTQHHKLAACTLLSGRAARYRRYSRYLRRLAVFCTVYRGISWLWRYWYRHVGIDDKYRGIVGIAQHYSIENWLESMVKLCHVARGGPIFLETHCTCGGTFIYVCQPSTLNVSASALCLASKHASLFAQITPQ